MNKLQIRNHYDVPGYAQIKTKVGTIFLDSLIENHPQTVKDFLKLGGCNALLDFVIERENKYAAIIKDNPNDIDLAIDEMYGSFKYDSQLDQEVEKLENDLYLKEQEHYQNDEFEDFLSEQEMTTLSEDEQIELYDDRTQQKSRNIEAEMILIQMKLDENVRLKDSLYPIKIAI